MWVGGWVGGCEPGTCMCVCEPGMCVNQVHVCCELGMRVNQMWIKIQGWEHVME